MSCGVFPNEVFVDSNGHYVGDFALGDGPAGPFGWVKCMELCDRPDFFFGIFDAFETPACVCSSSGWRTPNLPIPGIFGVQAAYTVADATGPAGLEDMAAMQVDLPGTHGSHLGWAGAQVIDPATGAWIATGPFSGDTGWNPSPADTWRFQCWVKVIPDDLGADVSGAEMAFGFSVNGFGESFSAPGIVLSDAWQFYQVDFNGLAFPTAGWCWPVLSFTGDVLSRTVTYEAPYFDNTFVTLTGYAPKGRVLIKCPHLYQLGAEVLWLSSFHGRGYPA